jgi:hypothetical protein
VRPSVDVLRRASMAAISALATFSDLLLHSATTTPSQKYTPTV